MPSANADHLPIVESRYPPLRLAEKYFKSRIPANLPPTITPIKAIKLQKRCRAAIEHGSGGGMFEAREILKRHDLPLEALGYPLLQGVGVLDLSRPGLDLTSEGLNADSWIKEQDEVWRAGWEQDVDPLGGCQPDKFRWIDVRKRTCEGLDEELRRFEEPKGWISRWNTTERDESSVSGETDSGSWTLKRAIIVAPGKHVRRLAQHIYPGKTTKEVADIAFFLFWTNFTSNSKAACSSLNTTHPTNNSPFFKHVCENTQNRRTQRTCGRICTCTCAVAINISDRMKEKRSTSLRTRMRPKTR